MSMSTMQRRLDFLGGSSPIDRINKQKLRSLRSAFDNDYNSRVIDTKEAGLRRCLIKNDTGSGLHADYDKKFISIEFDSGLKPGDTFKCIDDNTHWMVYLPVLTETAYLRAQILRCRYQYEVNGKSYWIYFQGPTETDVSWTLKQNNVVNKTNWSGTIYIENNDDTRAYFDRFTKMQVGNQMWEVMVVDTISVPGIIELEVDEYNNNSTQELPDVINESKNEIHGKVSVDAGSDVGYIIDTKTPDWNKWSVFGNDGVSIAAISDDGKICQVSIASDATGSFKVMYDTVSLDVTIRESSKIVGPTVVYPYDRKRYRLSVDGVTDVAYKLDCQKSVAKITSVDDDGCVVEIVTGKSNHFTVSAKVGDDVYSLPVEIKSL